MIDAWITSPAGRKVLGLMSDAHPAWLWVPDSAAPLWRNRAARLFGARLNKHDELKPAPAAEPIRGQVKRLLRLGIGGQTSLSRVQLMQGDRPVSQTCRVTPLRLADGARGLLCVSADAIDQTLLDRLSGRDPLALRLLAHAGPFVLTGADGDVLAGSEQGLRLWGDGAQSASPIASREELESGVSLLRLANEAVSPPFPDRAADDSEDRGEDGDAPPSEDSSIDEFAPDPDETMTPSEGGRLSGLMTRLDDGSRLYDPLGAEDDEIPDALRPPVPESGETGQVEHDDLPESEAAETITAGAADDPAATAQQWRVTGRGFVPGNAALPAEDDEAAVIAQSDLPDAAAELAAAGTAAGAAPLDNAARYNFDELARILSDRVSQPDQVSEGPAPASDERPAALTLNLSDEMLVLNRLPLGVLVFRDQDIVFANRAMADLLGCQSIAELRARGLEAIFPRMDGADAGVGPVARLIGAEGRPVPVAARLQAITWQAGPALMLSARREDTSPSGEVAVRSFVQGLAVSQGDGFMEISRGGVIDGLSGRAADLLQRKPDVMIGRPLALFVVPQDIPRFKAFLELPARRAGTERPSLYLTMLNGLGLRLFVEGSAGIVTGYFGLLTQKHSLHEARGTPEGAHADAAFLARLSRGVRRPLNTVIGFAQLIEAQAFGPLDNPRYREYARDIHAAGDDIAGLIDELDQFSKLQDGQYVLDARQFDLNDLLGECETVVRQQAVRRQVFVRSAVAENLPLISADRATMRQAILNLLASAIDQTPAGGKVILSAQVEDDGSLGVHVRDSSRGTGELAEQFAVFREAGGRRTEAMVPLKSSIGLALTRSLLAVNACSLSVYPASGTGTLTSLVIPADLASPQRESARED